jgi:hypothetical protein
LTTAHSSTERRNAVECDRDSGDFLLDDRGTPVSRRSSMLIRWSEVEYLDFIEA